MDECLPGERPPPGITGMACSAFQPLQQVKRETYIYVKKMGRK